MKMNSGFSSKITDEHLAKLAYVYVRQSSNQVLHHAESTELQYELVERASNWDGRKSGFKSSMRTWVNLRLLRKNVSVFRS